MLKCASVYTYELDDGELALSEIKAQLDEKITLLENVVGIVMCHTEFIRSGMVKYLGENLPFELAGVTTASQAVNDTAGEMLLTIFVMTADDVQFRTGVTENITDDVDAATKAAYEQATVGMDGEPKLAFAFPPMVLGYTGDAYIRSWSKLIPTTPIFGTLAVDDTVGFSESETVHNGTIHKTAMAFVLCYGNIHPRFVVESLTNNNDIPYKGEVTRSEGAYVYEIDHMNAKKYFESLDFFRDMDAVSNLLLVPLMIDFVRREDHDGVPVVRGHASFTEDGTAIFRGDIDEGSTFQMVSCNADDVIKTTLSEVEQLNKMPDVNGVIMFSCIVRRMMFISSNPLTELEHVREKMDRRIPFMMGYAGGEICPTSIRDGIPANRYHNYTLVALAI